MWKCKHCKQSFDFERTTEKANHTRWCDKNPKVAQFRDDNSFRKTQDLNQRFGKLEEFKVDCSNCGTKFVVEERAKLFPQKDKYFCGRSCSNAVGGKAKAEKYHGDDVAHYRTVCFRHHEKRCVVCSEQNIVAVHHLNEDHYDNRPENLVPLCPTHHEYMHCKEFKPLIENTVAEYVKRWKIGAVA